MMGAEAFDIGLSPEKTKAASKGGPTARRAAAEARYVQAVQAHRALPAGNENAEARGRAWASIKAAEREVVDSLWSCGEMADVLDLGRYVESYRLALVARVA